MTILSRRKPLVLWRPFELVFYCPPTTIYRRCIVSALRFHCFLQVRSFTLTPDISARIDYASSSLSDVLVSIGDRCGRNAHVPVFSTRIARFPMPAFKFHVEFLRIASRSRSIVEQKSFVGRHNRKFKKTRGCHTPGRDLIFLLILIISLISRFFFIIAVWIKS